MVARHMVFAETESATVTRASTATTASFWTARTIVTVMECAWTVNASVILSSLQMTVPRNGPTFAPSPQQVSTVPMYVAPTTVLATEFAKTGSACATRERVWTAASRSVLASPCAQIMVSVKI